MNEIISITYDIIINADSKAELQEAIFALRNQQSEATSNSQRQACQEAIKMLYAAMDSM